MYPSATPAKHAGTSHPYTKTSIVAALLLATSLLSGCSGMAKKTAQAKPDNYCLSAGQHQSYDCSKPASDAAEPLRIRDLPIDDATLYARVAEIRQWLEAEKARLMHPNAKPDKTASAPLIPPAPKATRSRRTPQTTPEEMLATAIALGNRKQYGDAIDLLDQYHKLHPEDLSAALVESRLLYQSGQVDAAEKLLKQQLNAHPDVAELYNNLAVIQAAKGDLGAAIGTLQQAFATDPSFARIQKNLKTLYAVSASQALLPNPQQTSPKLNMIDAIPKR